MSPLSLTTGTMRPVQRNFYDPSSAPGKGIVWEWESDCGSWTPYDMELCVSIQNAYEKQHPWLDLSSLGFSYVVDFNGNVPNQPAEPEEAAHPPTDGPGVPSHRRIHPPNPSPGR